MSNEPVMVEVSVARAMIEDVREDTFNRVIRMLCDPEVCEQVVSEIFETRSSRRWDTCPPATQHQWRTSGELWISNIQRRVERMLHDSEF